MNKTSAILILIFSLLSQAAHAEIPGMIFKFGVVPQYDNHSIHQIWDPILALLENRTGYRFVLHDSASIEDFEREFQLGLFDFVYSNPYHMLLANERQGYQPLVRDRGTDLYGIIVVSKDSPVRHIDELQDKTVAFPSPTALGATLMTRSAILEQFHVQVRPVYVNTHTSVYLNVVLGETDAGGGVQKTLSQQDKQVRDSLRILFETEHIASHPISAHVRVAEAMRMKVKAELIKLGASDAGRQLLKRIPIEEVGEARMEDYQPVRKLVLESLFKE